MKSVEKATIGGGPADARTYSAEPIWPAPKKFQVDLYEKAFKICVGHSGAAVVVVLKITFKNPVRSFAMDPFLIMSERQARQEAYEWQMCHNREESGYTCRVMPYAYGYIVHRKHHGWRPDYAEVLGASGWASAEWIDGAVRFLHHGMTFPTMFAAQRYLRDHGVLGDLRFAIVTVQGEWCICCRDSQSDPLSDYRFQHVLDFTPQGQPI